MAVGQGFGGGATGVIKLSLKRICETADKHDENGALLDQTTCKAVITQASTEFSNDYATNQAVNGQSGADVVIGDDVERDAQGYAQRTVTHRILPGVAAAPAG